MKSDNRLFEDAILIAIEVVNNTESRDEILDKLTYILDCYRERKFYERLDQIKRELGIWRKIP